MSAHRSLLFALCTAVFVVLVTAAPVGAQTIDAEPIDRGDPPEVFVQEDLPARAVGSPAVVSLTPDPIELLILAAVGVIVLGLMTLLITNRDRYSSRRDVTLEPSSQSFLEASRVIHASENVRDLCQVAAERARELSAATGAMITIDGFEGMAGKQFDVPTEVVFQANREMRLVTHGSLHALPISNCEGVVGLIVIDGGRDSTLEAVGQLVEDGYAAASAREQTAALVFVDGLTGIANRRRFDDDLDRVMGIASDSATPVALAMFDVDHFKTFNDSNGHQAGDVVLRSVAELIASNLRATDVVYRYGGEEFVALLPGASVDDAYDVVDRIRRIVESTPFEGEDSQPSGTVTLSVGIAAAPAGDGSTLVRAADMALYEAKTSGRNRVMIEASLG